MSLVMIRDNSGTLPPVTEVEVESSSSSSEMESITGVQEADKQAFNSPSLETDCLKNNTVKCKCCGKRKTSNRKPSSSAKKDISNFTANYKNSGPLAKKYLSQNNDFHIGIHFDSKTGEIRVGSFPAAIDGDDIVIDFGGDDVVKYKGTEGVWRLLTQDQSYFNQDNYYTDNDWVIYMEIIMRTNADLIQMIQMENPEKLTSKEMVDKFSARGWGWGAGGGGGNILDPFGLLKPKKRKPLFPIIPKLRLGFDWPELKLGAKNLGMSNDDILRIPGLENLKSFHWFQSPETVKIKELDDYLRQFMSLVSKGKEVLRERVLKAAAIIIHIVGLIGRPDGWAKFIIWSMTNHALKAFRAFSNYILHDLHTELHIPGTNFCGPGTHLMDRLNQGQTGNHPTDEACKNHDLVYHLYPGQEERKKGDVKLGLVALYRLLSLNAGALERFAGIIIVTGMSLKVFIEFLVNFITQYGGVKPD